MGRLTSEQKKNLSSKEVNDADMGNKLSANAVNALEMLKRYAKKMGNTKAVTRLDKMQSEVTNISLQ